MHGDKLQGRRWEKGEGWKKREIWETGSGWGREGISPFSEGTDRRVNKNTGNDKRVSMHQ